MNRVAFNIFGFNVYYYSLCILLGVIVAYILITREGKKQGLTKEFTSDLIFYTLIIGILGARVYYCVFNLDYYLANPSEILKIYNGGLAIHGGVIAGLVVVYFYTKKKNISFIINQKIDITKTIKAKIINVIAKANTKARTTLSVVFDAFEIATQNAKKAGSIIKAKTYLNLFFKTSISNHDRIKLFFINIFLLKIICPPVEARKSIQ